MKKLLIIAALSIPFICQAQFNIGVGTNQLSGITNCVVIPYGIYQTETKQYGYGGAFLYRVTDNFWAGVRMQHIGSQDTTAGVQAQLKVDEKVLGITLTPFVETTLGMGSSSLYGSTGAGALVHLYSHKFKAYDLDLGFIADYEHYISGNLNGNQVCAGPMFHISF